MKFSEIKPFVRFARKMILDKETFYPLCIPCDARIFYTQKGEGKIEVSGQNFKMSKGDMLVINSGVNYKITAPEDAVTYIVFNFDYTQTNKHIVTPVPPVYNNFKPENIIENISFSDKTKLNRFLFVKGVDAVENMAEAVVREYSKKLIGFELKSGCILAEILVEAIRLSEMPEVQGTGEMKEVLDYIQKNYNQAIDNTFLAEKFGFHPNYLSKLVKISTGLPMHKYILQVRILNAVRLLEKGTYKIGEIAEMCGFYDIYHFSKYFKSVMGVAPTEFLKQK